MSLEFNTVQVNRPKRNYFEMNHDRKFSFQIGMLVPIMCQEVLPGDKFSVVNEQLLRFAPLLAPIMHRIDVYTHYFFVPNRILWSNWEEFITGNQGESPSPAFPYVNIVNNVDNVPLVGQGSVGDYLGIPSTKITVGETPVNTQVSALPLAAYHKIWNEYYRDQNLQDEIDTDLIDGDNSSNLSVTYRDMPQLRAWEHDYFTSALPWTQKGEEVFLTFETEANIPVDIDFIPTGSTQFGINGIQPDGYNVDGSPVFTGTADFDTGKYPLLQKFYNGVDDSEFIPLRVDNSEQLEGNLDLSGAYLMTVNELRKAMAIQRWLELNARGGSRYIETILAHFGVKSSDARLQRPEYLGGGKSNVAISEVLQMSQSDTTPQGTMSGHGINYGTSHEFSKFFEEHGYIIGIISVMPKTAYQDGLPKHFQKFDKLDYYWSTFAHLGEQEIKNKELYINSDDREGTFGYVPRYSEYKFIPSTVHGDFRGNLDFWHMGRIFDEQPALNGDFITCDFESINRAFAVQDGTHNLWCHLYQRVKAIRPIPVYSTPRIY